MGTILYIIIAFFALALIGFFLFTKMRKGADKRFEDSQYDIKSIEKLQKSTIVILNDVVEFLQPKYSEYAEEIKKKIPLAEKIPFNTLAKDAMLKDKMSNWKKDMEEGLFTLKDLGSEYLTDKQVTSFFNKINIKL